MKRFGWLLLLAVLALPSAQGQEEPGQTPRPKAEPVREPTEEELVRLDKDYPTFAALKDDAPYTYVGKRQMDAVIAGIANDEEKSFEYVLAFAKKQPLERMSKYSAKGVPIENLYRPIRQDYLRELIHLEGNLRAVLPVMPTKNLKELDQIDRLYECYVAIPSSPVSRTVCVVVSELPAGIEPGEDHNVRIAFDAYYFKLWHYETKAIKDPKDPEKHQWERAPLLLGKTFEVRRAPAPESTYTPGMLMGLVGGLAALILAGLGMGLWFRKGDKNIKAAARQKIDSTVQFEDQPEPPAGPVNRIADQF